MSWHDCLLLIILLLLLLFASSCVSANYHQRAVRDAYERGYQHGKDVWRVYER